MSTVFDPIAPVYDELWTNTPVGRAQRDQTWRHLDPLFPAGTRLLDIGCGTGEDAAHFSARGVIVHAVDPSPAMVEIARRRVAHTVCRVDTRVDVGATFDAVLSNFGPFNCIEDVTATARSLAAVLHPTAPVAICIIGRFCLWETIYYLAHFRFRKAFRRLHRTTTWSDTPIHYPTVSQLRAAFSPDFTLTRWTGIGLFVPPSYVRLPRFLVTLAAALDRIFTGLPILRTLCDHRLLIFTRK